MRIVAILGGGDWADASVDHLVIPEGMKLAEMKAIYDDWYQSEYLPMRPDQPKFISFTEYLKQQGARSTTSEEVEEFQEY
jgi:hypothetical protein